MFNEFTVYSKVPQFIKKLYVLVQDQKTEEIITWDISGKSILIKDEERFVN